LQHLGADGAYAGQLITWLAEQCRWVLEIVQHLVPVHTFHVLKRRWVVERTFAWWGGYRRLSKDYEVQPAHSEAWMLVAMISVMVRRLAPPPKRRKKSENLLL